MANVPPGDARYLALTTYRRDGRPVTTPVWAAPLDGRLYVVTAKSTGKARGVRATGRVRFDLKSLDALHRQLDRVRSPRTSPIAMRAVLRYASSVVVGSAAVLLRDVNVLGALRSLFK